MWRLIIAIIIVCPLVLEAGERVEKSFPGGQYIAYEDGKAVDYWRVIDGYTVRIKDLELDGRELSVIIINQREGDLRQSAPVDAVATDPSLNYVPAIFSYIRRFARDSYSKRFGDTAMSVINQERDFLNGVSNMVVVTERNNLAKILGTFRNVHRGNLPENQKLDLETRLHIDLPEEWTENKTLIKDPDAPDSLYDFLWVLQDDFGFYKHSNRKVIINGEEKLLEPTHVAHEAAPAQRRLYRMTLKFKSLPENEDVQWHTLPDLKAQMERLREKLGDDYKRFKESPPVFGWNRVPVYFQEFIETRANSERPKPLRRVTMVTGFKTSFFHPPLRQEVFFNDIDPTGMPDLRNVKHPSPLWNISIDPNNIPFYQVRNSGWLRDLEKYQDRLRDLDRRNNYHFFNLLPVMPELKAQLPKIYGKPLSNPFHPTDIFVRLGLSYDSPDGLMSEGEFWYHARSLEENVHNRFNTNSDPGRTSPTFGEPTWRGQKLHIQDRLTMAKERDRLIKIYQEEEKLGLFDSRLEDDTLLTDRERILRILNAPSYFFSDISWAVDKALKYYFDDPEFQELFVKWIQAAIPLDRESQFLGIDSYESHKEAYQLANQNPIKLSLRDENSRTALALIEIRRARYKINKTLEERILTAPKAIDLIRKASIEQRQFSGSDMPSHLVIESMLAHKYPEFISYALDGLLRKANEYGDQEKMAFNLRAVYEEWKKNRKTEPNSVSDFIIAAGADPKFFLATENHGLKNYQISWRRPSSAREETVKRLEKWWPEFAQFLGSTGSPTSCEKTLSDLVSNDPRFQDWLEYHNSFAHD